MDLKKEFLARRRQYIELEFADLNPAQQEAVYRICGPELVLAGAGTGKTTVVTRRIAYMVKYGNAWQSVFLSTVVSFPSILPVMNICIFRSLHCIGNSQMQRTKPGWPWQTPTKLLTL